MKEAKRWQDIKFGHIISLKSEGKMANLNTPHRLPCEPQIQRAYQFLDGAYELESLGVV
jgi:hypothetical protein